MRLQQPFIQNYSKYAKLSADNIIIDELILCLNLQSFLSQHFELYFLRRQKTVKQVILFFLYTVPLIVFQIYNKTLKHLDRKELKKQRKLQNYSHFENFILPWHSTKISTSIIFTLSQSSLLRHCYWQILSQYLTK